MTHFLSRPVSSRGRALALPGALALATLGRGVHQAAAQQTTVKLRSSTSSGAESDLYDQLLADAEADFRTYDTIALDLAIERILIDGDHIDMYVHWQGQWKPHGTDVPIRERGHGRLQWVGNQSILLRAVDGDLPFGMGSRQTRLNRPAPPAAK